METGLSEFGDACQQTVGKRNNQDIGGNQMSKGNKKQGNREAKKPKKVKEQAPATANFANKDTSLNIGKKQK